MDDGQSRTTKLSTKAGSVKSAAASSRARAPRKPRTDEEARKLAIKNGWGPWLKHFPEIGKA